MILKTEKGIKFSMNKKENIILLGFICFILFFAIFLQIKTIENTELINNKTSLNSNLRDNALKWQQKYKETIQSFIQRAGI